MRTIKFKAWDKNAKKFVPIKYIDFENKEIICNEFIENKNIHRIGASFKIIELMQYTGLKDKNGLKEVYEGDIIDSNGNIKGNIYQMDKEKTDLVIQGFGTKNWCKTYRRAILLGCKNSK